MLRVEGLNIDVGNSMIRQTLLEMPQSYYSHLHPFSQKIECRRNANGHFRCGLQQRRKHDDPMFSKCVQAIAQATSI